MSSLAFGCSDIIGIPNLSFLYTSNWALYTIYALHNQRCQVDWQWWSICRHSPNEHRLLINAHVLCDLLFNSWFITRHKLIKTALRGTIVHHSPPAFLGSPPTLPIQLYIEINLELDYSSREHIPHYRLGPSVCVSLCKLTWKPCLAQTALSSFTLFVSIWSSPPPPVSLLSLSTVPPACTFFFCRPLTSSVHAPVCFSPRCHP